MDAQSLNARIMEQIEKSTLRLILSMDFSAIDTDALSISIDMKYNRSTVSRALNTLHRTNFLIKVHGRPTYYFSRKTICDYYGITGLDSDLEGLDQFRLILSAEGKSSARVPSASFSQLIGGGANESLYRSADSAVRAAMYPAGPHFYTIFGPRGTGKQSFCYALFELEQYQNHAANPIWIDFNSPVAEQEFNRMLAEKKHVKGCIGFLHAGRAESPFLSRVISWVNSLHWQNTEQIRAVAFTTESETIQNSLMDAVYPAPVKVCLPALNARTMKERILFILSSFQKQCDLLGINILLNKPCFQSFLIADYPNNLRSLNDAVRLTCQNSYFRNYPCGKEFTVRLQDLPGNIFEDTEDMSAITMQLRNIEEAVQLTSFEFRPKKVMDIYTQISGIHLDEDGLFHSARPAIRISQSCESVALQVANDLENTREVFKTMQDSKPFRIMMKTLLPIIHSDHSDQLVSQLYCGLVSHLIDTVNHILDNTYHPSYSADPSISETDFTEDDLQIIDAAESQYSVSLPPAERQYVHLYLKNAESQLTHRTQIIVLCSWAEIQNVYQKYTSDLLFENQPVFFTYQPNTLGREHELQVQHILNRIVSDQTYDSFVIISDEILNQDFIRSAYQSLGNNLLFINHLSREILKKAMLYFEDPMASLSDFMRVVSEYEGRSSMSESRLAARIKTIIQNSLVFLDCSKVYDSLHIALADICQTSGIPLDDSLATRFIVHASFMIERCIRKQYLPYKNARSFLQANGLIARNIMDALSSICNNFSIEVPDTELSYLVEIFQDFM